MEHPIRILNLEDSVNDAELNQAVLAADGLACELFRVDTGDRFLNEVKTHTFDIILADYSLPAFDGLSALALAREECPDTPFIFVSGALGEEIAIDALTKGATDYVLKDRLVRLAPAVRRALKEREQRIEREKAEAAQRDQASFLRHVFESIAHPFYVVDTSNYEIVMANSLSCQPESKDRLFCHALAHGTDQPCNTRDHPCPMAIVRTTKRPVVVEHTHYDSHGLPRTIEVHGYPILNDHGDVVQMIEYCLDITERRRLEEALRSILSGTSSVVGTDFFRELVYHLAHALGVRYALAATVDDPGEHATALAIWANDAYAENMNYDLEGTPCENVVQKGLCRYPEHVQQLFPKDPLLARMGVESYMGIPLRSHSGKTLGILAVMDDKPFPGTPHIEELLTIFSARAATELERQSAEQTLARLATVVEQAAEIIVITSTEGRITYVNPAFEHTLGYGRTEVEGQEARMLWDNTQDAARYTTLLDTVISGGIWTGHIISRQKNGGLIDGDATVSPIRNSDGARIGYLVIMRDMTERLKLEAQLRQAQKMEAIGTPAGGIAHDFNNILSAIHGNLDLAMEDAPPEAPELQESLSEAKKAAERAMSLVHQILSFSRQTPPERKVFPLNALVEEVVGFMRASIPSTIEMSWHVPGEPLMIYADATQIHQVLVNLCTNAYHAMRDRGGRLVIELAKAETATPPSREEPPEPCARLSVHDTGAGIPPDILDRIFDPFFTTKAPGEGTGLGLSVVHGIVESHGGTIRVSSEMGKGSAFTVFLPLWAGEQREEVDRLPPSAHTGHGERILVVDDEEVVVSITRRCLSRLGYHVVSSTDSRRALDTFNNGPEAFDLVITDYIMPHLNGLDMAVEMLRLRPELPIVLCTGYSEPAAEVNAKAQGIFSVLRKPTTTPVLVETVALALNMCRKDNLPKE